jgi:hypothetical protein
MVDKITNNKLRNKAKSNARKKINDESDLRCLICHNKVDSFCHSHSVPHSIFEKMNLENNQLCSHETICQSNIITSIYSGKNNSGIFKNICRKCDTDFFSMLDNMNVLKKWNNDTLRLQTIRILLYEIYRKQEFILELSETEKNHINTKELEFNLHATNEQVIDLKNEFNYLLENEQEKFETIFECCLNYKTNFSCVTLLTIYLTPLEYTFFKVGTSDITEFTSIVENGYMQISVNLSKADNLGNIIYLAVLPTDAGTKVILYSKEKNIAGLYINMEFEDLSEEKKLEKISEILSVWGNNMHGNEIFFNNFSKFKKYLEIARQKRDYDGIYAMKISDVINVYDMMENNKYNLFKE